MRKLLPIILVFAVLVSGCASEPAVGPGIVTITETTTSTTTTSTSTSTTSTIPVPTAAAFTFSPLTPFVLQVVKFNASTTVPQEGRTIVRYDWDFGDGTEKTGITSTHDFFPSGTYLVTLTVTDNTGRKTMTSQPVTVRPVVP